MELPETADNRRARTKVIATVGPASRSDKMLRDLLLGGADLFRLNAAHGTLQEHGDTLARIREAADALDRPVAILLDLAGPKIRLGQLSADPLECRAGQELRLVRRTSSSNSAELTSNYPRLVDELAPGDRIMLADGSVALQVISRHPDAIVARVMQGGTIRSRQGINLPGVKLGAPALAAADIEMVNWAARKEIDFIGQSFVRSPADVLELKSRLKALGSTARVIAKIEKPEALKHLRAIVDAADGIMIARGDLGVEIDVAQVPLAQKEIIAECRRLQKPVITATQMLDSMQTSPRPTRAEASDVANAIIDGTDACMLSGETAIGRFPKEAVEMMHRIACATEQRLRNHRPTTPRGHVEGLHPITQAVVNGASLMAADLKARLMVVVSRSGATALALSKQRNFVHTLGVSASPSTLRQMCLYWGVVPVPAIGGQNVAELLADVEAWGRRENMLTTGDRLVVITGTSTEVSGHNLVVVHQVT